MLEPQLRLLYHATHLIEYVPLVGETYPAPMVPWLHSDGAVKVVVSGAMTCRVLVVHSRRGVGDGGDPVDGDDGVVVGAIAHMYVIR